MAAAYIALGQIEIFAICLSIGAVVGLAAAAGLVWASSSRRRSSWQGQQQLVQPAGRPGLGLVQEHGVVVADPTLAHGARIGARRKLTKLAPPARRHLSPLGSAGIEDPPSPPPQFSSRLPSLPPFLPSRRSSMSSFHFNIFSSGPSESSLRRKPSWIDEDAIHGPQVRRARPGGGGARFSIRESWPVRTPTLPRLTGGGGVSPERTGGSGSGSVSPQRTANLYSLTNSPIASPSPPGERRGGDSGGLDRGGGTVIRHHARNSSDAGTGVQSMPQLPQSGSVPATYPYPYPHQYPIPAAAAAAAGPRLRQSSSTDSDLVSILQSTARRLQDGARSERSQVRQARGAAWATMTAAATGPRSPVPVRGVMVPSSSVRTVSVSPRDSPARDGDISRGDHAAAKSPRREAAVVETSPAREGWGPRERSRRDSVGSDLSALSDVSSSLSTLYSMEDELFPPSPPSPVAAPAGLPSSFRPAPDPFFLPPPGTVDSPTIRPLPYRRGQQPQQPLSQISGNAKPSAATTAAAAASAQPSPPHSKAPPTFKLTTPGGDGRSIRSSPGSNASLAGGVTAPRPAAASAAAAGAGAGGGAGGRQRVIPPPERLRAGTKGSVEYYSYPAAPSRDSDSDVSSFSLGEHAAAPPPLAPPTNRPLPQRPAPRSRSNIRADENGSPLPREKRPRQAGLLPTQAPPLLPLLPLLPPPPSSPLRNVSSASTSSEGSSAGSGYDDDQASFTSSVYSTATAFTAVPGLEGLKPRPLTHFLAPPAAAAPAPAPAPASQPQDRPQHQRHDSDQHRDSDQQPSPGRLHASIGELRRMNSQVSLTSSSASAPANSHGAGSETPTLPALRGGGFAPVTTRAGANLRTAAAQRNYLGMGGTGGSAAAAAAAAATLVELRMPRVDCDVDAGLANPGVSADELERARRQNAATFGRNRAVHAAFATPPLSVVRRQARADSGPVLRDDESVESLGLYDADGFLVSSPARDTERRQSMMMI